MENSAFFNNHLYISQILFRKNLKLVIIFTVLLSLLTLNAFQPALHAEEVFEVNSSTMVIEGSNEFDVEISTRPRTPIKIKSDYAEYIKEDNTLFAKGNVKVDYQGTIIRCNEMNINISEKFIVAEGSCSLKDGGVEVHGDSITYNYDTKDGTVINADCRIEEWYLRGPKMEKKGNGRFILYNGYGTSCELPSPHYRLSASRIVIIPRKWMYFYFTSLRLGNIPVLPPVIPFPVIPIPLKEIRTELSGNNYELGVNTEEGVFARAWLPFTIFQNNDGMMKLEYSSKAHLDFLLSLDDKYNSEHINGNFLIKNNSSLSDDALNMNWQVFGQHNQDIPFIPGLNLKGRINYMNKDSINRDYIFGDGREKEREEMVLVTKNIESNIALSYIKSNYSISMIAERNDKWDDDLKKFCPDTGKFPYINFNLNPKKIFSFFDFPVYFKAGANLRSDMINNGSNDNRMDDYFKMSADASSSLSTSFNVNKLNTFGMSLNYTPNWRDRTTETNLINKFSDSFYGGISWNSDLRNVCLVPLKMNYALNYDLNTDMSTGHSLSFRIESLRGKSRKHGQFEAILSASMSLPQIVGGETISMPSINETYDYFITNLSDINLRVDRKTGRSKFYLRSVYDISEYGTKLWKPKSMNSEFNLYEQERKWDNIENKAGWYWTNKIRYFRTTYADNKTVDTENDFGFWLTDKWRLNFNSRLTMNFANIWNSDFSENKIEIYRDLHCWEVNIYWQKRATFEAFWIKFNIKAMPKESRIGVERKSNKDTNTNQWSDQWGVITE